MGDVILVTGGAGYIGSHTVMSLQQAGHEVLVLDDFSEGHLGALRETPYVRGSLLDRQLLKDVFGRHTISGVVHFAARCYVGESVERPGNYYENNVIGTLNLLDAMVAAGAKRLVFSSTCATYGEPEVMPIREDARQLPVNPYGNTKLLCEYMMRDFAHAHGMAVVALRYFNAAGADPETRLGEDHRPESHLIPLVLSVAAGRLPQIKIFGDDYPTPDGTCLRDYVHVTDLATAHVLALQSLLRETGFRAFNLGNANGSSVAEVIAMAEQVTGKKIAQIVTERRLGDPPVLVGSPDKIVKELGWDPQYSDLETIISTAWRWHSAHPEGYGDS